MSTLIGHRERFAVEFELREVEPEHRKWLFGTLCVWADGHRIGRHDEECAMTVALTAFPGFLRHGGNRVDSELMAMPAEQIFSTIHAALYEDDKDRSDQEVAELSRKYSRFEALPNGLDVFDGWRGYLVEDRLAARLIWQAGSDKIVHEAHIGAGEYDRVIDRFLTELETISGQTRSGR